MSKNVVHGLIFLIACAIFMIAVGWVTSLAMSEPTPAMKCHAIMTGATCNVVCWPDG